MNYDDETLMAYADGELDDAQRADIASAIERDPALAHRVQKHRALRSQVAGAFAPVIDEPVPERLLEAARSAGGETRAQSMTFTQRQPRTARIWGTPQWLAMAASLVVGVILAWQWLTPGSPAMTVRGGALLASGELARALDAQRASTQSEANPVQIGITLLSREGDYCRSFMLREGGTAGLACRVDAGWRIEVTAAAELSDGGMRQAASPPPAVLRVIEARIAGEPLDAAGEEQALRDRWMPARP